MLTAIKNKFANETFSLVISGSAGMGMAESCDIEFVQEVYAEKVAAEKNIPDSDVYYRAWRRRCKNYHSSGRLWKLV